jgi:hypothetical protein
MLEHFKGGFPDVLKNGLVVSVRTSNSQKRRRAKAVIAKMEARDAEKLAPLFKQAVQETKQLMPQGESVAQEKDMTAQRAHKDAWIYYKAYAEGDYESARRGVTHLRSLAPRDREFRSMLGFIHSAQANSRDALREWLYGFSLEPSHAAGAGNLILALINCSLLIGALDVHRHYLSQARLSEKTREFHETANKYARYAEALVGVIVCKEAGIDARDFEAYAVDALSDRPVVDRPWLTPPTPSTYKSPLADKRIFISYRRADAAKVVLRLRTELKLNEPSLHIFVDEVEMIGGGDFREQLAKEIRRSDLLLLVIGPSWASVEGLTRLNDPSDVLRKEVALALSHGTPILPIVAEDAHLPLKKNLPADIRPLVNIHAVALRSDHFAESVREIERSIRQVLGAGKTR